MARTNRYNPTDKQKADKKSIKSKSFKRNKTELKQMCKSY